MKVKQAQLRQLQLYANAGQERQRRRRRESESATKEKFATYVASLVTWQRRAGPTVNANAVNATWSATRRRHASSPAAKLDRWRERASRQSKARKTYSNSANKQHSSLSSMKKKSQHG